MRWIAIALLPIGILVLQTGSVAAAPAQTEMRLVARVLELTNTQRQNAGLRPLTLSPELTDAAQNYSQVLASSGCFEHTCGPVPNFVDRIGQTGYTGWTWLGENIGAGYPTPEAAVTGWMESAAHRDNILSPAYTEIGIGLVTGSGQWGSYWTQEFGSRPGPAASDPAATGDDGGSGE